VVKVLLAATETVVMEVQTIRLVVVAAAQVRLALMQQIVAAVTAVQEPHLQLAAHL
jgi:hypothetical protein